MNDNANDIREMPYAEWLEGALRRISVIKEVIEPFMKEHPNFVW